MRSHQAIHTANIRFDTAISNNVFEYIAKLRKHSYLASHVSYCPITVLTIVLANSTLTNSVLTNMTGVIA